ncbi:MAG: ornithine carbamoyltransferase [Prochlorococcus marinus XMU1425]|nr:ornithine carbamoyltransferase [Prochlorococcus marinus XMU1425]MCR8534187.1 ornithine carbamoyltransferase [Prochlorococcus marinus XMU1426]
MSKSNKLANNNFLSSLDLSTDEVSDILELASDFKNKKININLKNKVLGLIFDKSSTRTRVSFQVAMTRLGGSTIDLNPTTSQIGRGEPIKDTARVLSRYCDVIAIRTFDHSDLEEYAKWSTKPVINALTDLEHPCQALADFLTIHEEFLDFKDVVLTFIGDGNNVANSLILCGALLGVEVRIACPKGYEPNSLVLKKAYDIYQNKDLLKISNDPHTAVLGSNVLYTDVWSSMGEENKKVEKDKSFKGFTIDDDLVSKADKDAIVLHCLPAYRGKEITDEIFESKKSRIFDQAENRLHVQQALLSQMIKS